MSEPIETLYMDAVLTPNRSLSKRGFLIVMIGISLISFSSGLAFYAAGALPVAGFFGLDVLAIYLAFRWTFKAQKESTQVKITSRSVHLAHTRKDGSQIEAHLPTAFTRVHMSAPPSTPATRHLHVESGQKSYVIGRFLIEEDRASLADAMTAAINAARAERYPSDRQN